MGNELPKNTTAENKSLVVEIIGPAGAGKTTLIRALSQRNQNIQSDIHLSKIRQFPFLIINTSYLLPTYLRQYRHSRWFNRRETRSMNYLKAVLHHLRQQESRSNKVTILDHGPIYRLAFLRELGPEITTSQLYNRWWTSLLDQWVETLDMIIWLDAPNAILLERIHARNKWHSIKEKSEQEAHEYLTHYRGFLKKTIAESVADRQVTLLRFNTKHDPLTHIVDEVLAMFCSAPYKVKSDFRLAGDRIG